MSRLRTGVTWAAAAITVAFAMISLMPNQIPIKFMQERLSLRDVPLALGGAKILPSPEMFLKSAAYGPKPEFKLYGFVGVPAWMHEASVKGRFFSFVDQSLPTKPTVTFSETEAGFADQVEAWASNDPRAVPLPGDCQRTADSVVRCASGTSLVVYVPRARVNVVLPRDLGDSGRYVQMVTVKG